MARIVEEVKRLVHVRHEDSVSEKSPLSAYARASRGQHGRPVLNIDRSRMFKISPE